MSTFTFLFLCIQLCLIQNAFSTLIGPGVYGNGFGLGNSEGARLTAEAAALAGWYGPDSPASYGGPWGREMAAERALERQTGFAYGERAAEWDFARSNMWNGPYSPAFEAGMAPFAGYGPAAFEAGAYGGEGIGDVAVAGEMPVAGTTLVAGQVPILGAVRFAGDLPAGGVVSIAGSTGCGCGRSPYMY